MSIVRLDTRWQNGSPFSPSPVRSLTQVSRKSVTSEFSGSRVTTSWKEVFGSIKLVEGSNIELHSKSLSYIFSFVGNVWGPVIETSAVLL